MFRNKLLGLVWLMTFVLLYLAKGEDVAVVILLFSLIYGFGSAIYIQIAGRRLNVKLEGSDLKEKGDILSMKIELRNGSLMPIPSCKLHLLAKNRLTEEAQNLDWVVSLGVRGTCWEELKLSDRYCGMEEVTIQGASLYDPLRIFRRKLDLQGHGIGYFIPAVRRKTIPGQYLDSYNMESYRYSQYEKGSDSGETFAIRDYAEGDSLKAIHWKLSAKMDDLMVKIPSYPIENNILLMLDNCTESELAAELKNDLMELFWSLSEDLVHKNIPHSVGWYDHYEESFQIYRVRSGENQWRVISRSLAAGFQRSSRSTVYHYIESLEGCGFSNHFIVSAGSDRDLEKLERYGEVRVFRKENE